MFSFYRLIPHCISKNVRTLFCETTKLSPALENTMKKHVNDCKTTKDENHVYQVLLRNKFQLWNVRNRDLSNEYVGCTIVVNVGYDNDLSKRAGLPHLLEHVISASCYESRPCDYSCVTKRFHTVYSFQTTLEHHDEVLKIWANSLFSRNQLRGDSVEKIIETERWRVHNEFMEKRYGDIHGSALEILKVYETGTDFPKFGWGYINTLKGSETELLKELNELRELYLQRPVVICTYSAHDLKMKTTLESINVANLLLDISPLTVGSSREKDANITKPLIVATSQKKEKPLIVATSQQHLRKLVLIFPVMNKLNVQERNTLKWIAEMIGWTTDGLLLTKLRDYKLATHCEADVGEDSFLISVYLTDLGLKQIQCVCDTVKRYLHFLCDHWTGDKISGAITHMKHKEVDVFDDLKTNMAKSADIATRLNGNIPLNGNIEDFNYELLHSGLEGKSGADFISEHLLKNKNVAHMIYHRSPSDVLDILKDEYTDCVTSEEFHETIFDIPFYIVENLLFETNCDVYPHARCCMFMWMEFEPFPFDRIYCFSLADPREVAFKMLFEKDFLYRFYRYESLLGSIRMRKHHQRLYIVTNTKKSCDVCQSATWFTESKDKFSMVKQDTLADMSRTMSNSETFAESLMETYVKNANCKNPIDPIFMQYKTLINTDYEDYCKYCRHMIEFTQKKRRNFGKSQNINHEQFSKVYEWFSINSNDVVTTTLIFYQTSQLLGCLDKDKKEQIEYGLSVLRYMLVESVRDNKIKTLYTAKVINQSYGHVHGFLCKILSVENIQDFATINKMCRKIFEKFSMEAKSEQSKKKYPNVNLQKLCDSIIERRIVVQIIGHKNPKINAQETFEKQLDEWMNANLKKKIP